MTTEKQSCMLARQLLLQPCLVLQLLWRFNREAVALRIQYLMHTKPGAESHTVFVTDIPLLDFGTIPHRIETTVFRYLPVRIKVGLLKQVVMATMCAIEQEAFFVACWGPRACLLGLS